MYLKPPESAAMTCNKANGFSTMACSHFRRLDMSSALAGSNFQYLKSVRLSLAS